MSCILEIQNAIRIDPDDMVARNGLERCLKASFTIRNGPDSSRTRIIDNEIEEIMEDERIKDILNKAKTDPTSGIDDDYYTGKGFTDHPSYHTSHEFEIIVRSSLIQILI